MTFSYWRETNIQSWFQLKNKLVLCVPKIENIKKSTSTAFSLILLYFYYNVGPTSLAFYFYLNCDPVSPSPCKACDWKIEKNWAITLSHDVINISFHKVHYSLNSLKLHVAIFKYLYLTIFYNSNTLLISLNFYIFKRF